MATILEIADANLDNAGAAIEAARITGLYLPAALALWEQESMGKNVYGNDRDGTFAHSPGIPVTEENYAEYYDLVVNKGKKANGVGPLQITYKGFHPQAKKEGLKLWDPIDNGRFGFKLLLGYKKTYGSWELARAAYKNGAAAANRGEITASERAYARRVTEWEARLKTATDEEEPLVATSQNGWSASSSLKTRVIEPAKGVKVRVRDDDDVAYALNYVGEQWHKRVEPLNTGAQDDWGFNYRANANNPNELSNHSSGTAVDYNATQHPNGVATSRTFSAKEAATIREIVGEFDGALRWGGDYTKTVDAMHVEVNVSKAKLAAAVKKHKAAHAGGSDPKPPTTGDKKLPTLSKGDKDPVLVPFLKRFFYAKPPNQDSVFGSGTQSKVKIYQAKNKLTADGIVGPKTWAKIASGGTKLPDGYKL